MHLLDNDFATPTLLSPVSLPLPACVTSVPAEGDVARSVTTLLHQWFVELSASTRVDGCPAVFTVILEACDIGAEERSELASTPCALALITQLVVQDIWLHFHLRESGKAQVNYTKVKLKWYIWLLFIKWGVSVKFLVRARTDPFIDLSMLQLNETSTDSSNVALLIRKRNPACTLRVLQLRVCVNPCVAHTAIQPVHDHRQLH